MAAALTTGLARALTGARRSATAAVTSAAAAAGRRGAGPAMLPTSAGRMVPMTQRLAALHGAAVVCSAGGEGVVEVEIKVDGMVCDGCSSRVQETLEKMAGVKKVHVDLEKGLATVAVEAASQLDALSAVQPLAQAIQELGFEAAPHFGEAQA